ncbi:MAG: hypothetical protein OQJ77_05860 [Thiovulaceae bacterium]|nr:hypothetical protein [Sulfurimonadaceae bacterium]
MKIRLFLLMFLFVGLFTCELFAESKIKTRIEASLIVSDIKGDIKNLSSTSDFVNDLGYSSFNASYFSIEVENQNDYVPNIYFAFFSTQENADSTLDSAVEIAEVTYSSEISSTIDYNVLNLLFYENMLIKGGIARINGYSFYPGDLEFDIGIDIKYVNWEYHVIDKSGLSNDNSWIKVDEFIPLPYLGFKYYRYKLFVYGNVSALSFQDAKSISAEAGIDYFFVNNFSLSIGYVYENFDIKEDDDTVYFQSDGVKLGFKYTF